MRRFKSDTVWPSLLKLKCLEICDILFHVFVIPFNNSMSVFQVRYYRRSSRTKMIRCQLLYVSDVFHLLVLYLQQHHCILQNTMQVRILPPAVVVALPQFISRRLMTFRHRLRAQDTVFRYTVKVITFMSFKSLIFEFVSGKTDPCMTY